MCTIYTVFKSENVRNHTIEFLSLVLLFEIVKGRWYGTGEEEPFGALSLPSTSAPVRVCGDTSTRRGPRATRGVGFQVH